MNEIDYEQSMMEEARVRHNDFSVRITKSKKRETVKDFLDRREQRKNAV